MLNQAYETKLAALWKSMPKRLARKLMRGI